MFRFEKLDVWKASVVFSKNIYAIIRKFPHVEQFALCDQLRRAVVSVPTNIAEGSGSDSNKDFRNFLNIALKSLHEVVSLLAVSLENKYIQSTEFGKLYQEAEILARRIQTLKNSLQ